MKFNLTSVFAIGTFFGGMTAHADPQPSTSGVIDIVRSGADGVISLNGPSCKELTDQDRALRIWTASLGETPGNMSSPLENTEENLCTLNINDSVPSIVRSLQDFKPAMNGPNCWNTALRLSGLVESSRYTSPEEMTFWMNSPYCRELSGSEQSLPGDIVEIRSADPDQPQSIDEIHGMIYLSDALVFSKNTSSHMSPYGIQRASLVYQTFRIDDPKCEKVHGHPNDCSKWANHYRCKRSENDRLSFEKENNDFAVLSNEVRRIEYTFSEYVMGGRGDYEKTKDTIEKQLADIENKILSGQNGLDNSGFFFQALLQDINSLKSQIAIITKQQKR